MSDLLVILNPRRIEECMRSYAELDIDRLWLRYMDELDIEASWPDILDAASGYERLLLISDDGVVRQQALDAVITLLDEGHPVVTGYSNLDATDPRVNITRSSLRALPGRANFDFWTLGDVLCWPERVVPTTFCGFCLTGMSLEMWERFRFVADHGPDWNLSKRLAAQGIPIVAAREAFVWHMKEQWGRRDQDQRKAVMVGMGHPPPEIELESKE